MDRWWLAYCCPDCGAPAGQECDDDCPSGLAAHIETFEADMEGWNHLDADDLARERRAAA